MRAHCFSRPAGGALLALVLAVALSSGCAHEPTGGLDTPDVPCPNCTLTKIDNAPLTTDVYYDLTIEIAGTWPASRGCLTAFELIARNRKGGKTYKIRRNLAPPKGLCAAQVSLQTDLGDGAPILLDSNLDLDFYAGAAKYSNFP